MDVRVDCGKKARALITDVFEFVVLVEVLRVFSHALSVFHSFVFCFIVLADYFPV